MSEYLPPPPIQTLAEILPTEPLLLMGAGPVPISHAVSQAKTIDYIDSEAKRLLRRREVDGVGGQVDEERARLVVRKGCSGASP